MLLLRFFGHNRQRYDTRYLPTPLSSQSLTAAAHEGGAFRVKLHENAVLLLNNSLRSAQRTIFIVNPHDGAVNVQSAQWYP